MIVPFLERRSKARKQADDVERMLRDAEWSADIIFGRSKAQAQRKAKYLYRERQRIKAIVAKAEERRATELLEELALLDGVTVEMILDSEGRWVSPLRADSLSKLRVRDELPHWMRLKQLKEAWRASDTPASFEEFLTEKVGWMQADLLLGPPGGESGARRRRS